MAGLTQPALLPGIFADGAVNHEDIPDTNAGTGRMAWDIGFPSETSLPEASGGVPPRRLDMNGLGNKLSQHIFWQQSGSLYSWDATLDYPVGAHILDTDANSVTREYIAVVANGPGTGNAIQPSLDVSFTCWKSWERSIVDMIYPVGSIYMSLAATSPSVLFGGTWVPIEGRFLLASSTSYPLETTGGATMQALTVNNMPAHNHTATSGNNTHYHSVSTVAKAITVNTASAGAHTHGVTFPKTTLSSSTVSDHKHGPGSMEITGTFSGVGEKYNGVPNTLTGAFYVANSKKDPSQGVPLSNSGVHDDYFGFKASRSWTGQTSANGGHNHTVTISATSMTTGSAGAHTHSVTVNVPAQTNNSASNTHNHTITVDTAGGNTPFSIMPPYMAVNVWRRTA